jgi:hypothetical protein
VWRGSARRSEPTRIIDFRELISETWLADRRRTPNADA